MSFNLATAITSIAPTLATMLGGPLAGTAVTALENVFGVSSPDSASVAERQDTLAQVLQTAGMSPEVVASMRAADQKHAEMLSQQGIDLAKINADAEAAMDSSAAGDRASARTMQTAARSWVPAALSVVVTLGLFGVLGGMLSGALHASDSQALLMMLGSLTTGWGSVMAFWFGTTHDSGRKTELLAQSTPPARAS